MQPQHSYVHVQGSFLSQMANGNLEVPVHCSFSLMRNRAYKQILTQQNLAAHRLYRTISMDLAVILVRDCYWTPTDKLIRWSFDPTVSPA
jgi:hypothetical protein